MQLGEMWLFFLVNGYVKRILGLVTNWRRKNLDRIVRVQHYKWSQASLLWDVGVFIV